MHYKKFIYRTNTDDRAKTNEKESKAKTDAGITFLISSTEEKLKHHQIVEQGRDS